MSYERLSGTRSSRRYRRNYFFRSLGLELPTLLTLGHSEDEVPKPVFRTSTRSAFSESAVHIIPSLASLTIVILNLKTIYLGRTLTGEITSPAVNIALLQVTAKLVELFAIASLTSMVVHTVRTQMVVGDGVPLGAISGIFMFSSLSYLWSPELWGSLGGPMPLPARIRIYGVLLLSGVLAATLGPATAVLLIPKEQDWDAGGSEIYIRGSPNSVWPSLVELSHSGQESLCALPNATDYPVCPSGGYRSMSPEQKSTLQVYNKEQVQQNLSSFMFAGYPRVMPSTIHWMPRISLTGIYRSFACETSVTGVHGAETIYFSRLLKDWQTAVASIPYSPLMATVSQYKYYDTLRATAGTRVPTVRVACSNAQNLTRIANKMDFPVLPKTGCWSTTATFEYKEINQTLNENVRATWVSLPEQFGRVSAGLLFESPWVDNSSRVALGCSIDARWANATLSCSGGIDLLGSCKSSVTKLAPGQSYSNWPKYSEFRPLNNSAWTSIELQQDWLDVLTPRVGATHEEEEPSPPASTLEQLLENTLDISGLARDGIAQHMAWNDMKIGSLNRTTTLEWVIASIVADGLSREGSARVLDVSGEPTSWSLLDYDKTLDFTHQLFNRGKPLKEPKDVPHIKQPAKIMIFGYSYKARVFTDYLSISVHLIYMLLASYHTITLILRRRVSACWDSITEFFALMQNSQPATKALRNTCAGVRELRTYAQVAFIRVVQSPTGASTTDRPHLELMFRGEEPRNVELTTLSHNSLMEAKPLRTSGHSRTWAPGSSNSVSASLSSARELRPFEREQSRRRLACRGQSEISKIQDDTVYS